MTLTRHGTPTSIGVEYLSASEHGINLCEAGAGTHDARLAERALRHADVVAPGIMLARGRNPTAARIGSTSIGLYLEPPGSTLRRGQWIALLRRLRATA